MKHIKSILAVCAIAFLGGATALYLDRTMRPAGNSADTINEFLRESTPVVRPVDLDSAANLPDFRGPVAKLSNSVVSVDRLEQVYDFFGDSRGIQQTGTGSGVIISADGYILTNNHVVEGADRVTIRLQDDRTVTAKVVGTDPRSDLAVLKVDTKGLVPAALGDSSKLQAGEWVIAIGNPLGYSNTVSVGVVSNLNRTLQTGRNTLLVDGIQTDAAINQGNSGGALANSKGELIGINSAIVSNSGGNIGLGFAIPINRAKRVVADILKFGRVRYGTLGITPVEMPGLLQSRNPRAQLARFHGAEPPQQGVIVREVGTGTPADQAGLKEYDVIVKIENSTLNLPIDLTKALIDKRPGDKVRVTYWSKGQTKTVDVTLQEPQ